MYKRPHIFKAKIFEYLINGKIRKVLASLPS